MTNRRIQFARRLALLATFAIAMAYLEAAVVVYLRGLYYPDGFAFPLRVLPKSTLFIEIGRELATVVMLASVAIIAATRRWERFGWFLFVIGAWDVWYYVWLKVMIDWPTSLFEWDVLFLIPIPWVGPVIAPLLIAISMIAIGPWMALRSDSENSYSPQMPAWILGLFGVGLTLYSFTSDTRAVLNGELPQPYSYWLLAFGLGCLWAGFLLSLRPSPRRAH